MLKGQDAVLGFSTDSYRPDGVGRKAEVGHRGCSRATEGKFRTLFTWSLPLMYLVLQLAAAVAKSIEEKRARLEKQAEVSICPRVHVGIKADNSSRNGILYVTNGQTHWTPS